MDVVCWVGSPLYPAVRSNTVIIVMVMSQREGGRRCEAIDADTANFLLYAIFLFSLFYNIVQALRISQYSPSQATIMIPIR